MCLCMCHPRDRKIGAIVEKCGFFSLRTGFTQNVKVRPKKCGHFFEVIIWQWSLIPVSQYLSLLS